MFFGSAPSPVSLQPPRFIRRRSAVRRAAAAGARRRSRRASILLLVLVVVAMMTLAGFTFTDLMINEHRAARLAGRQLQTEEAAQSAVDLLIQYLAQDAETIRQDGGYFNNPERFQGILFLDSDTPRDRLRVTIIAPGISYDMTSGVRYGLEDESNKINLNMLMEMEADAKTLYADEEGEIPEDSIEAVEASERALNTLMQLPGMTTEIADAILDWLDADYDRREEGAEDDYYSGRRIPYFAKNGPLDSLDELLLVKGVTPDLLFGPDVNRTMYIEPEEQFLYDSMTSVNLDDTLNRGWASYLTLYSAEHNRRPDGTPKVDLNGDDLQLIYDEVAALLGEDMASFVVLYRQFGPYVEEAPEDPYADPTAATQTDPTETDPYAQDPYNQAGATATVQEVSLADVQIDLEQTGTATFHSILDLIDAMVPVNGGGQQQQEQYPSYGAADLPSSYYQIAFGQGQGGEQQQTVQVVPSPFTIDPAEMFYYLPILEDNFTVGDATAIPGRINISQATGAVLQSIPGIDETIVSSILSIRDPDTQVGNIDFRYASWPLFYGLVDLDQMKALWPYVTGGGHVLRAQIIAFYEQGGGFTRLDVVIDATQLPPRVLSLRDITHLGRGFDLETLGASLDAYQ